tara:strand:- start:688 stop:1113 length:426 start_codon:yes stop_codon:yes gene_type:complete
MAIKQKPEYVVVTCVSTFRNRYVIPVDELQRLNPDEEVDPSWALDAVTCEDVKEFSQRHVGEQIIDAQVLREPEVLQFFDADNDYLKDWTEEQKISWIHDWRNSKMSFADELALQEKLRAEKMVAMEEENNQFAEDLAKDE